MTQKSTLFKVLLVILFFASKLTLAQVYCPPTFANGCSNWRNIAITAGTINWTAPTTCTTSDFTTLSTVVAPGGSLAMTDSTGVYCGCSVWVDFNLDGDFDDIGENLYGVYVASANYKYVFSINIPGTTPVGLYRMRVIASWGSDGVTPGANGSGGCGAYQYGNYDDFTLNVGGVAPCLAPTGINAGSITPNSATLSWSAASGASNYEYVLDNIATNPSGAGTSTTSLSYNASGLSAGTLYYFHIRTNCGSGNYSPWTSYPFTTLAACLSPATVSSTSIGSSTANLFWSVVTSAASYEYVLDNTASSPSGAGTSTTATTYNASALNPSTLYYLHVRSNCGSGNYSPWTSYNFTTLNVCPSATGLLASNITSSGADLSWSAVSGATAYQYVVDNNAGNPSGAGINTTLTTYSASGLTGGTLYYLHVRSDCGSANYSVWSTIPFTTLPTCPPPTSLLSSGVTATTATLSWTAPAGAVAYEYVLNTSATAPGGSGTPTASTVYNASSLTPSTLYYFYVRSSCGIGNYSTWASLSFTTKAPNGVNDVNKHNFFIEANPNPVSTMLSLKITGRNGLALVKLNDINGRTIHEYKINSDDFLIDTHDLASGMYLLNYQDNLNSSTLKIRK